MLVLTRKKNQRIYIGDDIVVEVLEIDRNGQIRIGIEAPRDVIIAREELVSRPPAIRMGRTGP